MFGLQNKYRLKTVDWFLLHQLHFRQKTIIQIDVPQRCKLRIVFYCIQKHSMRWFSQCTFTRMAQSRYNKRQMSSIKQMRKFLTLNIGDDLVEKKYAEIVDLFLILFVQRLHLAQNRFQVVDKLLLIRTRQCIEPLQRFSFEDDGSLT